MVEFKKPNKAILFDLINIRQILTQLTGREIDIVEEEQKLKTFSNKIKKERLLVYGN